MSLKALQWPDGSGIKGSETWPNYRKATGSWVVGLIDSISHDTPPRVGATLVDVDASGLRPEDSGDKLLVDGVVRLASEVDLAAAKAKKIADLQRETTSHIFAGGATVIKQVNALRGAYTVAKRQAIDDVVALHVATFDVAEAAVIAASTIDEVEAVTL